MTDQEWIDYVTEPNFIRRGARLYAFYITHPAELRVDVVDGLTDFYHFCQAVARLLRFKLHAH